MSYEDHEAVWEAHMNGEFVAQDVDATMATMTADPFVVHVPTAMGGRGRDGVRAFYEEYFVGHNPTDFRVALVSRTVGADRIVDELLVSFTHDIVVPWLLPGIAPTGRRVEIPGVAVVEVHDDRIASEHMYRDEASVLAQVGLLDLTDLPGMGADEVGALVDDSAPMNALAARRRADVPRTRRST